MATQSTKLDRQLKAVRGTYNACWVKIDSRYESNAFECPTSEKSYQVSITKNGNRWFVYAEDHEPSDIIDQPENGFRTLAEAKVFADDFGSGFESCWNECNEVVEPLTIEEIIDLQMAAMKGHKDSTDILMSL